MNLKLTKKPTQGYVLVRILGSKNEIKHRMFEINGIFAHLLRLTLRFEIIFWEG